MRKSGNDRAVPERVVLHGSYRLTHMKPEVIRQMLDLLPDNAVQYTLEGGTVVLSAAAEKEKIYLVFFCIADRLPEVPPYEPADRPVRGNTARIRNRVVFCQKRCGNDKGKIEISFQGEHGFQVSVLFPMA